MFAMQWPPGFADMLDGLMAGGAGSAAISHYCWAWPRMEVIFRAIPAVCGPYSMQASTLEASLLAWLQGDTCWPEVAARLYGEGGCKQCLQEPEASLGLKYEEAGYIGELRPQCSVMATLSMENPIVAKRISIFARAFIALNRHWLEVLTAKIRAAISAMPPHAQGENGRDFLKDSLTDVAFVYSVIQIVRDQPARRDPRHVDGGASLLHLGLTINGKRSLQMWFKDSSTQVLEQQPGSIYIANLVACDHQVVFANKSRKPDLLDGEFHVTVTLRSDVFRHNRARQLSGTPGPADMFHEVNEITARQLAEMPLSLPTMTLCARRARGIL